MKSAPFGIGEGRLSRTKEVKQADNQHQCRIFEQPPEEMAQAVLGAIEEFSKELQEKVSDVLGLPDNE